MSAECSEAPSVKLAEGSVQNAELSKYVFGNLLCNLTSDVDVTCEVGYKPQSQQKCSTFHHVTGQPGIALRWNIIGLNSGTQN